MKVRALVVVGVLSLLTAACASHGRPFENAYPAGSVNSPTSDADLSVRVENGYYLAVRVFVDWPGDHRFMGEVAAGAVQTFSLPADLVRKHPTLRLFADTEGSVDDAHTQPLEVRPGQYVTWTLSKILDASRAYVM